jgi:hypothetical protein
VLVVVVGLLEVALLLKHEMAEVGVFVMEIKFQLLPVTHIPLLLVLAALVALSILVQAVRAVAVRLIAQVLWP